MRPTSLHLHTLQHIAFFLVQTVVFPYSQHRGRANERFSSAELSRREAIRLISIGACLGRTTVLGGKTGLAAALEQAASKVTIPRDAIIRTVLKDISPETLGSGTTLFHDHLSMSSPRPYAKPTATPPQPQWLENVDAVIDEVKAAASDGVSCIVSGGTRDLGQKPENIRRIAERVAGDRVHIVLSDALWIQTSYPPDIAGKTEDQIAEDFVRDATAQRWGALGELGSSMTMHPDEHKVFRAVAKTHLRTGLPIFTHMPHEGCKACGTEQLEIFESLGVNPRAVCIGHLSDIHDDPKAQTQIALAKRGAFVGFDTVGHTIGPLARGEEQARMLLSVLEAGYEDPRLAVLRCHFGRRTKAQWRSRVAMSQTVFVPRLRAAGVTEATLHKIQVDNPRRFLAFVPRTA